MRTFSIISVLATVLTAEVSAQWGNDWNQWGQQNNGWNQQQNNNNGWNQWNQPQNNAVNPWDQQNNGWNQWNQPQQQQQQGNPWDQQNNGWNQWNQPQQQQQGNPWDQQNNGWNQWNQPQQQQGNPWDQQNNGWNQPQQQQQQGNPWDQWNQQPQQQQTNPWEQQQPQQQTNPWEQQQPQQQQTNPWEQQQPQQQQTNPWEQQQPQQQSQNQTPAAGYMKKLNVVNTCPREALSRQGGVNYPSPKKVKYHSKVTNSDRPLNILLPDGYSESKKYPVLYFLHGIMQNEDSMLDQSMGSITIPANLFKQGKAKQFITVFPNEYTPEGGKEVPAGYNQAYYDGYDNFINDLVGSIMPYVESNYPVLTGRENTAICGFSMGGRNALYIGFKRSDLFGYVAAFSPAPGVVPGTDFSGYHKGLFTENNFRAEVPHILALLSCGTSDSVVGQFPKSYHELLTRNNQEHVWFEVPGADHNGDAVSAGFYNFVSGLFGALN